MICPSASRKSARKQSLWKTGLLLNVYRSSQPFYCSISSLARLIQKDRKAKEGWQEDEMQYPSPTKGCVSQPAQQSWWPSPFADTPLSAPNDLICWLNGLKEAFYFPWLCLVCSDPQGLLRQNVSTHYSFLAQVIFIRAKQSQHTTQKVLTSRLYARSKIQAIPMTLSSSLKSHHNLKLYCNILKKNNLWFRLW